MNDHDHTHERETPAELRGIESALDRLGAAERASAPGGLEGRVLADLRRRREKPPRAIPIHRHRAGARTRLVARLGAVAAVVAVVGGAWLALRTTAGGPATPAGPHDRLVSFEQSVEDLLLLEELLDEMASVDTTAVQDEAEEIDSMIGSPWDLIDTIDTAIGGEAI